MCTWISQWFLANKLFLFFKNNFTINHCQFIHYKSHLKPFLSYPPCIVHREYFSIIFNVKKVHTILNKILYLGHCMENSRVLLRDCLVTNQTTLWHCEGTALVLVGHLSGHILFQFLKENSDFDSDAKILVDFIPILCFIKQVCQTNHSTACGIKLFTVVNDFTILLPRVFDTPP